MSEQESHSRNAHRRRKIVGPPNSRCQKGEQRHRDRPYHRGTGAHHHPVDAEKAACTHSRKPESCPAFPEYFPDSESDDGDMKSADRQKVGNPVFPVKFIDGTVQILFLPEQDRRQDPGILRECDRL